ncbi:uncharacterized protein LOC135225519 [Macrobrachium nipponense]|uniref:uncharacterized protein LOC135225519 n=1 Tax=Macrobrachium nipponense TaxID=159736 RepID=UPI0030C7CB40
MIQELSVTQIMHSKHDQTHGHIGHHSLYEDAKSRTCSAESDRSFLSDGSENNNSSTCQHSCCREEATTQLHRHNKSKKTTKKAHKKRETIDSDFLTYFICRRP